MKTKTTPRSLILPQAKIRGVLEGRVTQHRVPVKPQPTWPDGNEPTSIGNMDPGFVDGAGVPHKCPYKPGDRLWVKETWGLSGLAPVISYRADSKAYSLELFESYYTHYNRFAFWKDERSQYPDGDGWLSPVTMPAWAARIWLEIESVRVERIQSISEADARAEGAESIAAGQLTSATNGYVHGFRYDWQSRHPGSWDRNDFVWVTTFRRVESPQ